MKCDFGSAEAKNSPSVLLQMQIGEGGSYFKHKVTDFKVHVTIIRRINCSVITAVT